MDCDRRAAVPTEAAARDRSGARHVATCMDKGEPSSDEFSPSLDVTVGTPEAPQTEQGVPYVGEPDEMETRRMYRICSRAVLDKEYLTQLPW